MKNIALIIAFLLTALATAGSNPQYRSLRVHGMGNAFVAVADNKDALYYNPAGLYLINRLGNFEKEPDLGYMPRNPGTFSLVSLSLKLPTGEVGDLLDVCEHRDQVWTALNFKFDRFSDINWCKAERNAFSDMKGLDSIGDRIVGINGRRINVINTQLTFLEYSMHNFAFSIWTNTAAISPYIDLGVFFPGIGYDTVTVDIAFQTGFAFSPIEKWSFGMGIKGVQRNYRAGALIWLNHNKNNMFSTDGYQDSLETFLDTLQGLKDIIEPTDLIKFNKYNLALDFGTLYQIHREIRLGVSLRDIYFSELAGESITPNLSLGAMASPMILQSNSWFDRKVNFAMDIVDVINISDKTMNHLNFGAEITQTVIPSPARDLSFWPSFGFGVLGGLIGGGIGYLVGDGIGGTVGGLIGLGSGFLIGSKFGIGDDLVRVSAGGGFEGGYWSTTLALKVSFLGIRYSSWAEELGTKTGQKENRFHMIEIGNSF